MVDLDLKLSYEIQKAFDELSNMDEFKTTEKNVDILLSNLFIYRKIKNYSDKKCKETLNQLQIELQDLCNNDSECIYDNNVLKCVKNYYSQKNKIDNNLFLSYLSDNGVDDKLLDKAKKKSLIPSKTRIVYKVKLKE